ncbi:MAG: RDD family protein, partial [Gammaproteobacteria bacterium]
GQTIGMRAWRLQLIRDAGHDQAVSPIQALGRLAAACLSALPAGLGYVWILFDRRGLAWHDRLSGTRIVLLPPKRRER